MRYEQIKIGDTMPYDPPRGIAGEKLPVAEYRWHALRVPPMRERAACAMLKAQRVFAFCPMEDRVRFRKGRKIVQSFPTVTQIIYARFRHRPNWDVMLARKLITGVFCDGNIPIALHPDVIRAIQGLPTRAERLAEARAEMLRLRPGDRADMLDGPLAGFVVDVTRTEKGRVWWETIGGIKGSSEERLLAKRGVDLP